MQILKEVGPPYKIIPATIHTSKKVFCFILSFIELTNEEKEEYSDCL